MIPPFHLLECRVLTMFLIPISIFLQDNHLLLFEHSNWIRRLIQHPCVPKGPTGQIGRTNQANVLCVGERSQYRSESQVALVGQFNFLRLLPWIIIFSGIFELN